MNRYHMNIFATNLNKTTQTKQNKQTKQSKQTKQTKQSNHTYTHVSSRFSQSHFMLRVCSLLRLRGEQKNFKKRNKNVSFSFFLGGSLVVHFTWGFETSLYNDCYGCKPVEGKAKRMKSPVWTSLFHLFFHSVPTVCPVDERVFFYVE